MTILVTKSEETFLRTQVYPYWRTEIDHLHAQRTTNRATNMAIATGPHPSPVGAYADVAKKRLKEERKRTNVSKDVIVLLL
jgi:hypothetical protein